MTNVVLVRHEADYGFGNYLFETPVDLKKGQRVRVKTRRANRMLLSCMTAPKLTKMRLP